MMKTALSALSAQSLPVTRDHWSLEKSVVSTAEDLNLNFYLILHLRGHRRLMAYI